MKKSLHKRYGSIPHKHKRLDRIWLCKIYSSHTKYRFYKDSLMLIYIFLLIFIPTILSYLILKFIYRIIFKSQKKVSKFLIFLGSIGLIIFYYTPYSYYLEPSFHKFRNICKLDPEIYQANGGKLDEEYYNKVLAYFDTSLDTLDWEYVQENLFRNDSGEYLYHFKKTDNRILIVSNMFFKNNKATKDNIKKVGLYANWDNLRASLAGNEGTGFYPSGGWEDCNYFKRRHKGLKGLSNGTYILKESIRD